MVMENAVLNILAKDDGGIIACVARQGLVHIL